MAIIVAARHAEFTHIADTCWTAHRAVGCYYLMAIAWLGNPPSKKKKPEQFGFWAELELSQPKKIKEYRHVTHQLHHLQRLSSNILQVQLQIPTPVPVFPEPGSEVSTNTVIESFKSLKGVYLLKRYTCQLFRGETNGSTTSTFQHDTLIRSAHLTILDAASSAHSEYLELYHHQVPVALWKWFPFREVESWWKDEMGILK